MRSCNIDGNCRVRSLMGFLVLAIVAGLAMSWLSRSGVSAERTAAEIKEQHERQPMPTFALPDLEGRIWNLEEHKGRVVMVNFWATWCPPCRQETPDLVKVAQFYSDKGVDVVGITLDEDLEAVKRFVADQKIPYPILVPQQDSAVIGDITAIPVTLLVDKQGRVAWREVGMVNEEQLRKHIDTLLGE